MGLIPVQLMFGEMAKDGRSGGRWRSVEQTGTDEYSSFRVELSDEVLETLDIDPSGWWTIEFAMDTDGVPPAIVSLLGDAEMTIRDVSPRQSWWHCTAAV